MCDVRVKRGDEVRWGASLLASRRKLDFPDHPPLTFALTFTLTFILTFREGVQ